MSRSRIYSTALRYLKNDSSVSFWHTAIAPVFYDYETMSDYYIDLTAKTKYTGPRDGDGIIVLDYFGEIGVQYNPCAVAQLALGHYARWAREGEASERKAFLKLAFWLRNSLEDGRWNYNFNLDAYNRAAPWTSALAQAQGISVLIRAEIACAGQGFAEASSEACRHMLTPVEGGGLLRVENGRVFLEEVVSDRLTGILDGMMFAIFGLQDYVFMFNDREAKMILEKCIDTLEEVLPLYDMGFWSRADLYREHPKMIASRFYHGLHVAQLKVMASLSERKTFLDYAEHWEDVAKSPVNRARAFASKVWFKSWYY